MKLAVARSCAKDSPILSADLEQVKARFSDLIETLARDRNRAELKRLGIWIDGTHMSIKEFVLGSAGAQASPPHTTVAALMDDAATILGGKSPRPSSKNLLLKLEGKKLVLRFE